MGPVAAPTSRVLPCEPLWPMATAGLARCARDHTTVTLVTSEPHPSCLLLPYHPSEVPTYPALAPDLSRRFSLCWGLFLLARLPFTYQARVFARAYIPVAWSPSCS